MTQLLSEILKMSVPERILLVEAIWDSIAVESENVGLNEVQKREIQRRLESWEKNPENGMTWEEIKGSLRK